MKEISLLTESGILSEGISLIYLRVMSKGPRLGGMTLDDATDGRDDEQCLIIKRSVEMTSSEMMELEDEMKWTAIESWDATLQNIVVVCAKVLIMQKMRT